MKRTLRFFVAAIAAMGFAFAGCEGPAGPEGKPGEPGSALPEVEIDLSLDESELTMRHGDRLPLTATVYPGHALIQTVRWELYDSASSEIISIRRTGANSGSSALSGWSVDVVGLSGGEARIRVLALGGDGETHSSIVTVTVTSIVNDISALRDENPADGTARIIETVVDNDRIRPQLLCFGGRAVTITLRGAPGDVLQLHSPGAMFTVASGVTLVLDGIAMRGIDGNPDNALVVVEDGGKLEMLAGSSISGNVNLSTGNAITGGGVRVNIGGEFVMRGGEIFDNEAWTGGGVHNWGTFTMYGGTIRNNTASWGGGVRNLMEDTVFNMIGGYIRDNFATDRGGGVDFAAGTFNMSGGTISGNSSVTTLAFAGGGGVYVLSGTFNMDGGYITGNSAHQGGGVRIQGGRFNMGGGEISGNTAYTSGGGVRNLGIFHMDGGMISGNYAYFGDTTYFAQRGGGVHNTGTFEMHRGTISGNAAAWDGGGVANYTGGVFRLRGGTISGNRADDAGGGVFNIGTGNFTMHGGAISANTATRGGGVENHTGGTFIIGDGVIHGMGEGSLANTGLPGAALFITDALAIYGELNENGTLVTPPGSIFPFMFTNDTIRVEDGRWL